MAHKILVLEDDYQLRQVVIETLEDENYIVKGAAHVRDAVKLASSHPFDLAVTDVRMPDINGIEGFVMLKQILPELKCVVMTGYSDLPPKVLAVEVGVSEYLYKPFSLPELVTAVDRVVNSRKLALFYSNVIQKGPLRVLTGIFHALKKDWASEVSEMRAKVFHSLYLAIRCDANEAVGEGELFRNVIPKDTANGLYYQLDQQDIVYEKFLGAPSPIAARSLLQEYQDFYQKFQAFVRSRAGLLEEGRIEAKLFSRLYKSIQSNEIAPAEFLLAPVLRTANPQTLRASPELLNLRKKMWGE